MSKDMLGEAVRKLVKIPAKMLGIICALLVKLLGKEGEIWYAALGRFLRKENPWEAVKKAAKLLLEFVGTITIPATTEKFVSKDKFKVDTSDDAAVKISHVGDNFQNWFGDKIEEPISETTISCYQLKKASVDRQIITELGGEAKAKTTLAEVFFLMSQQGNGQNGVLMIDARANIFYVPDINGILRAVYVYWDVRGWFVDAYSVENPLRWYGSPQVFSRNPKP